MKYYFFDSVEVLKKFEPKLDLKEGDTEEYKKIILNEGFEEPPEGTLYIEEVIQSNEPLGFRVYRTFEELGIVNYGDYHIITEYPEQYNGIVADHHIMKWDSESDNVIDFHSDLVQLINKGYAKTPTGMKIENDVLVPKTVEEADGPEEQSILANNEIAKLKEILASTDYVVIKIAEGEATAEEYSDVIHQRKSARARINELETILNSESIQDTIQAD